MKSNLYILVCLLIFSASVYSQKQRGIFGLTNWTENWTNYKPKSTVYRDTEFILTGNITTNTSLSRKNCYLLVGTVVVKENATLTIEAGTIIKGDYGTNGTLIIEPGAKIIAIGTETDPVIFTSSRDVLDRKPGDWAGITICGKAPINKIGGRNAIILQNQHLYGGTDIADNSGVLKFVRIEFAGKKIKTQPRSSALTLAAVGNATNIENIQTSFSSTNGFLFLGGNLKISRLVSFKNYIHDFEFNEGSDVFISNSIAFRFPDYSDASISNAIEVKAGDDQFLIDFEKKSTTVKASNITIVSTDNKHQGNTKEAIFINKNTKFTLTKSIIHGFSPAIVLDKTIESNNLNNIVLQNVLFNQCKDAIVYDQQDFTANLNGLYLAENFFNEFVFNDISVIFNIPDFKSNSNFMLKQNDKKTFVNN